DWAGADALEVSVTDDPPVRPFAGPDLGVGLPRVVRVDIEESLRILRIVRPSFLRITRNADADLALLLAFAHDRLHDPPLHRKRGLEFEPGLDGTCQRPAKRRGDDKSDEAGGSRPPGSLRGGGHGGAAIPEERLVHNYLIEEGLARHLPKKIEIWEETLRDGEQTPGVAYSPEEKVQIARFLDEIHVPIMDVGIPVVSREEARAVRAIADAGLDATVMAAARTVRKDVEACIDCGVDEIALFTAGSDLHIRHKLGMTREQVKEVAVRETEYAVAHGVAVSFDTGIDVSRLYELSQLVERLSGIPVAVGKPLVGHNAFAHESGIHAHGVIKHTATYEPIQPERIGRQRTFVFGKHTGSQAVAEKLRSAGIEAAPEEVLRLVAHIKDFAEARSKKDQQAFIASFRDRVERQRGVTDEEFWSLAEKAGIATRKRPKS